MVSHRSACRRYWIWAFLPALFLIFTAAALAASDPSSIGDLKKIIEEKNLEIQKLEEEARQYRTEIAQRQRAGATLKQELSRIQETINQLQRDIVLTERKIQKTELEIEETSIAIREKEDSIHTLQGGLATTLRAFSESDREPTLITLLKHSALSDFLGQLDAYTFLQREMLTTLDTLHALQAELKVRKNLAAQKKQELQDLQKTLQGRKKLEETTRRGRNELLTQTKNQEKKYQELLRDREARRAALEDEIRGIEDAIRITIDPASLPRKGSGVLGWPLADLSLSSCWQDGRNFRNCITQFFGYTSFAAVGGYAGKGHNGVDFRAAVGTPIFASAGGVVEGVGDTDEGCRRASYGKWVLVRHPNNLSTLYAHLAAIQVSAGQAVQRGQPIGLSGASGYAIGPHLHLSVFASQAVRIESIRSRVCGQLITLPISAHNGYLNPLDYL